MGWNRVTELPLFWKPFYSVPFTLLAIVLVPALFAFVFGSFTFRSRIRGVYFSIITQALALSTWLMFNRNAMNLGGTNGLSGFKSIFGFTLNSAATQRGLYVATALCLCGAFLLCRYITHSPTGRVLIAIRDSETRVLFSDGVVGTAQKLLARLGPRGGAGARLSARPEEVKGSEEAGTPTGVSHMEAR